MRAPEGDTESEGNRWRLVELGDRELPRVKFKALHAVAIGVALLTAAVVLPPNLIRARAQGRSTSCKSNVKNIATALEMYSTAWNGRYPTTTAMLTPNYLRTIPVCPTAGKRTYRAYLGSTAKLNGGGWEDYYYVECYGENHTAQSITGNYPAYNSIHGLIERAP